MRGFLLALAAPQSTLRTLIRNGNLEEAERLAHQVAWLCLIQYGRQVVTAVAFNNLGIIKATQGYTQAAEALLRCALGAVLQPLQHWHVQTRMVVLMNLTNVSVVHGNKQDAWAIYAHDLLHFS